MKTWFASWFISLVLLCLLAGEATSAAAELRDKYRAMFPEPPARIVKPGYKELPSKSIRAESRLKQLVVFPDEERADLLRGIDEKLLAEYVQDNEELMTKGRELLLPSPWKAGRPDVSFEPDQMGDVLFLVKIWLAQNHLNVKAGDLAANRRECLNILQLGNHIALSGGPRTKTLLGWGVMQLAARHLVWGCEDLKNVEALKELAEHVLKPFEEKDLSVEHALGGEFRQMVAACETLAKGGEPLKKRLVEGMVSADLSGLWSDPRMEVARATEIYAEAIQKSIKDPPEKVLEAMEFYKSFDFPKRLDAAAAEYRKVISEQFTTWAAFTKKHPKADKVEEVPKADMLGVTESSAVRDARVFYGTRFRQIARVRLARAALWIRAWQLDHGGELPDGLNQLVPKYLPDMPLDPFDGKPLRYNKEQRLLWSVESDLKDDEGKSSVTDLIQRIPGQ